MRRSRVVQLEVLCAIHEGRLNSSLHEEASKPGEVQTNKPNANMRRERQPTALHFLQAGPDQPCGEEDSGRLGLNTPPVRPVSCQCSHLMTVLELSDALLFSAS